MREEEVKELSALRALGALDEAAAEEFDGGLRDASEEARREAEEMCEVAAQLPLALPPHSVPPRLRDELLARIQREPNQSSEPTPVAPRANVVPFPARTRQGPQPARWLLIAATVAFAALSGALLWQNNRLAAQRDELAREVENYSAELRRQRQELIARQQEINSITAPTTSVITLGGEADAPQASAKLVWDKANNRWVIYLHNLPAAPPDKAYQLWYITTDSAKISAQVFTTDAQGRTELRVNVPQELAPRIAVAAVTLEPKGGSPQPTGPIYLKGVI